MSEAILSKGTTLSYKTAEAGEFTVLKDLQSIPELGGEAEAIEITTLDDAAHMYMNGILNYGDSIAFQFLYKETQFATLSALGDDTIDWKVTLPDEGQTTCTFSGTASIKLDSVSVNAPLTYTLAVKPNSEMIWA